ncbi:MAG: class I mannose-6-phosphate isomerase [Opitutaceae bacterium]|nr:class I mannose-6-phosphate isomerase [Opitutaceae bacterium]
MPAFLKFRPIYQERVWGGRRLESFLGRKLPQGGPIGESWEMVDRPAAQSVVVSGQWAGLTMRELIKAHTEEIMGPGWPMDRPFPILVKWLDCRDRLSVQVHPPAQVAAGLGGEPKTENWYFAETDEGAAVYAGLRPGTTKASFEAAIAAGTVDRCLERLAVREGDSLLIYSGTMHAIDAGNVILEIQQNSDTTYRVYDWGRVGLDGRPRTLHVRQSLACLEANTAPAPRLIRGDAAGEVLARSPEFTLRRRRLGPGDRLDFAAGQQPRILSVVDGALTGESEVNRGDNVLLPRAGAFGFRTTRGATVLITEDFIPT